MDNKIDTRMMHLAIGRMELSVAVGDYGFGAVVSKDECILSVGHNTAKVLHNLTKHAEVMAIEIAITQRPILLDEFTLYSTCEPCMMCTGMAYWAGIKRVVYGMSQDTMEKLGKPHGYRRAPISLEDIKDKLGIEAIQFMEKECVGAFKKVYEKQKSIKIN